jgi:hypothetical protein
MNADQIAEIQPALREAFDGAPITCVTFEVEGDQERWLQVVDQTINAAYPHADDPESRLRALPGVSGLRISSWEAWKFVTLECPGWDAGSLATWIDAYFVAVLACKAGDYHVDVTCENLR